MGRWARRSRADPLTPKHGFVFLFSFTSCHRAGEGKGKSARRRRRRPWSPSRSPPHPAPSRRPFPPPRCAAGAVPPLSSRSPPPPSVCTPIPSRASRFYCCCTGAHDPVCLAGRDGEGEDAGAGSRRPSSGGEHTSLAPYGLSFSPFSKVRTAAALSGPRSHPLTTRSDAPSSDLLRLLVRFCLHVTVGSNSTPCVPCGGRFPADLPRDPDDFRPRFVLQLVL